jgi:hypothetical protein
MQTKYTLFEKYQKVYHNGQFEYGKRGFVGIIQIIKVVGLSLIAVVDW